MKIKENDVHLRVRVTNRVDYFLKEGHKKFMEDKKIKVSFNSYLEHLFRVGLIEDGFNPNDLDSSED